MRDWMTNLNQDTVDKQGMETRTSMMDSTTSGSVEGNSLIAYLDTTTTEGINTVVKAVEGRSTVASTEIMASNGIGETEQLMSRDKGIITKNIPPQKDDNRVNDMGYTSTSRGTTKSTSVTDMPMKKPVDMDSGMDSISEGDDELGRNYEKSGTSRIVSLSTHLLVLVVVLLFAY